MDPIQLLFTAIATGHNQMVKALLKTGIDPNSQGEYSIPDSRYPGHYTALDLACEHEQLEIIDLLLEAGADVNQPNRHLERPLHSVCFNGNAIIVQRLLEAGARLDLRDENGETPLTIAIERCHEDIVKLLLQYGAKDQLNTIYGDETPLTRAITYCGSDMISILLDAGADPNLPTIYPLHMASEINHIDAVQLLLKAKADPLVRNKEGKLPSEMASGQLRDLLLTAEADCLTITKPARK